MVEEGPTLNAPKEVYGLFAGAIDQQAVMRFHNALSIATRERVEHVHLLFQCAGGIVGDGVSLYNLFRAAPINLTLYNVGSVCSIGTIAFLGAKNRKTSKSATFMIHRAYLNPAVPTADRLAATADQMNLDDRRIEQILKNDTKIPQQKWEMHKYADVWFSADEALATGIATEIGEFAPPPGTQVFNIWGVLN